MKIMTCNIRCSTAGDGDNGWTHRKTLCCEVIRSRRPDVICCQEVREDQYADLVEAFPEFDLFGVPDEPMGYDPVNTVLYRRDAFDRLAASGFWLSETPHVPGSSSWESACIRLATWVRLRDRASQRELVVVNTHLDHRSQRAREGQVHVLNEWSAVFPPEVSMILTGDMNCDRRNPAIRAFKDAGWRSAYEAVHGDADPGTTVHWFLGPDAVAKTRTLDFMPDDLGRIDWIFLRGGIDATDAEIVRDHDGGRYPSDHYFLAAELTW